MTNNDSKQDLVLRLLPEIEQIKDDGLKTKVISCWAEAIEFRGWTEQLLRSIPFTLLAENVKITFIDHVRAVCRRVSFFITPTLLTLIL